MNKFSAKEMKKQRQSMLDDFEFMDYCFKIIYMEVDERGSSHNTREEQILSAFATKKQWIKHPMMYELVMGEGLDDNAFKVAINKPFYADGQEWKCERFNNDK